MIYFIKEDSPEGYIKIGHTEGDGPPRFQSLQTGNPRKLWVLGTLPGGQEEERALHQTFHNLRVAGEWFLPSPALDQYIKDNCTDFWDSPVPRSTKFWFRGEQVELAKTIGVSRVVISDILAGRRGLSVKMAKKLEAASVEVLGEDRAISAAAWLRLESHPALEKPAES